MPSRNSSSNDAAQELFASAVSIISFVCLECLVIVQALLAWQNQILTVSQMRQSGFNQGLPFVWHFAMWGDLLIVSGLAAYVIGLHSFGWHGGKVLVSFAFGFASATALSWTYTFSTIRETHVQDHHLTVAGVVHLFYMAIALAVFAQFFFFTQDASRRLLRVVSLLLLVHVFFGTHMVLGILNFMHHLNWYPARPLKSIPGWITVTSVAVGLGWRNIGTSAIIATTKNAARHVFDAVKWLVKWSLLLFVHVRFETTEAYLKALDKLCSIANFTLFSKLFWEGYRQGGNRRYLVLISLIWVKYYLSRLSVIKELDIAKSVFPYRRFPDELRLKDRLKITFQVTLFMAFYSGLGLVARSIILVSLCLFVIGCLDLSTRLKINEKVRLYFSDARYAPNSEEIDYSAIQSKREIITRFLFELPHKQKEAGFAAGCVIALIVAVLGYLANSDQLTALAFYILTGTLALNEIITLCWRMVRDYRLETSLPEVGPTAGKR